MAPGDKRTGLSGNYRLMSKKNTLAVRREPQNEENY